MMALFRTLSRLFMRSASARPVGPFPPGARVRLSQPLGSSQKIWIPAGATGIVVGGDRSRVSVELDTPRTVVTVPWAWVEDAAANPPAGPPAGRTVPRPDGA